MLRVLICQGVYYFMCLYMCVYYVKSVNMSRSLLFHVFIYIYIYVCTMLRVLICQGVYYFMCLYICVCVLC